LQAWEDRAIAAQTKIDDEISPDLERRQYEMEIARRLLEQAQDDAARETWRIQVDVLETMIGIAENNLAEEQQELVLCEAMIAAIEAELAADQPE